MPSVGAAKFKELLQTYGTPENALAKFSQLSSLLCLELSEQSSKKSLVSKLVDKTMLSIKNEEIKGYYFSQIGYPTQLLDLSEPPPVLFASSEMKQAKFAAVVGARLMTKESEQMTSLVVKKLVNDGYSIVSGGAAGIDSVAHKSALKCSALTVAVLGNGIDVVYPKSNAELFEEIRAKGNIISEFLVGTKPRPSFFPTRNRIIAALADVVVVIQASAKSGSMITAKWAKKLNRKVITIKPLTSDNALWEGNLELVKSGALIFNE